ncbi:hypothetical protein [Bathymodiolus thermophilus thioautotrophic gill symbiont]|jgi:hypothetical protein|uniref:Uncharacterized protein n=2 Tax=Bathymodiolus thermophilus thioautotrophic gill symbiont TaxID=2360 RepID=A0A1J5UL52_9GAMM|nr:hypothetical protein [Bathymodiolus thermophilus thioautotrophic gill symbiont]OIR24983.1 hypothetical protein BGC33_05145 [Bathymodiolus thermophilus thioautotrophic gill symbiont]CAB5502796.1 hypothetical protein THERMOS_1671 [Bathymodiolus thermophilus thioautotrophic gill symbiont]
MKMDPSVYLGIAFSGVIATFFANSYLQKKMIAIKNKEKAIDFLLKNLKDYESLCEAYWKEGHNENCASDIKIKYKKLSFFTKFVHKKYLLNDNLIIDTLLIKLFTESTGDDFDSPKKAYPQPEKIQKISTTSNDIVVKFLGNKI